MFYELIILLISVVYACAVLNGTCNTPNGEKAKCVPYFTCPVIYTSEDQTFKDLSLCDKDGDAPYVCCGEVGTFEDDNMDIIFGIFEETPEGSRLKPSVRDKNDPDNPVVLKELVSKELPDRSVCGIHSSDDRIFGGNWTSYDEFPWMAALEYKRIDNGEVVGVKCGGTVLTPRDILTAAHCVYHHEFELFQVRLGDWNLTGDPDCSECDPVKIVKIKEKHIHPYYDSFTKSHDIALLRLEEDVGYTEFIRPVCLPPQNLPAPQEGKGLIVSGWGATNGDIKSDIKLKAKVPMTTNDKCEQSLQSLGIQSNQLCAGGVDGKDACQGDSGGPIMRSFFDAIQSRFQWYQEGIVSQGVECGRAGFPGVYTRISRYTSWIVNTIAQ